MATPASDSYTAPAGQAIYAGRWAGPRVSGDVVADSGGVGGSASSDDGLPHALLDLIAAAPDGSWIMASTGNAYDDVWPPADYRPLFGSGPSNPSKTIKAWSSFAWDDVNHRLILWGGGHANSNANEVYDWSAHTLSWRLAYWPTDVVTVTGGSGIEPVDGPLNTPQSSHTYSNQFWLPVLQRFVTFGGAASSSGGSFAVRADGSDPARNIPAYFLDMSLAGLGYVGGTTGSNPQRGTSAGVSLTGAGAWSVRDWNLDHADPTGAIAEWGARTNGGGDVTIEGGHDVVYFRCGAGHLYRVEFVDLDYKSDVVTRVGQDWDASSGPQGKAYDSNNKIFAQLYSADEPIHGWNLNTAGTTNKNFVVEDTGFSGDIADFKAQMADSATFGLAYDERRGYFVAWQRGGSVYAIEPPASLADLTTGWTITKLSSDSLSPRPVTVAEMAAASDENADRGVCGKWKRSASLDVYIGLQDAVEGKVWMFKPAGWVDPRG